MRVPSRRPLLLVQEATPVRNLPPPWAAVRGHRSPMRDMWACGHLAADPAGGGILPASPWSLNALPTQPQQTYKDLVIFSLSLM